VPTTCMGATFPVLARLLEAGPPPTLRRVSSLYAVNTPGGGLCVVAARLWLFPRVRGGRTHAAAALAGAVVGGGRSGLGRPVAPTESRAEAAAGRHDGPSLPLATAALVGFAALAFEMLGFRLLLLVFGSTTYAFTIMLGVYLCGIAAGSALAGPLVERRGAW